MKGSEHRFRAKCERPTPTKPTTSSHCVTLYIPSRGNVKSIPMPTTAAAARPRRTQAERRATTRASLIAAAVEMVVRNGTGDVRLNEVAALAGVTKGAIQYHFASKVDLQLAVLEAGWMDLIDRIERIGPVDGPLADRVDLLVEVMWESYSRDACHASFVIAATTAPDSELRVRQEHLYRSARDTLERTWAAAFADTGLGPEALRAVRRFARIYITGLLTHRRVDPDTPPMRPQLETLKVVLAQMLSQQIPLVVSADRDTEVRP